MASRRLSNFRPGLLLLAVVIAFFLWGMAHGSSRIEFGFDVPIELHNVGDKLVVTDQSTDDINVRVIGTRAAMRNLDANKLKYVIDMAKAKDGIAEYEVDSSRLDLPRDLSVVARSPSRIQFRLEPRERRIVEVKVDTDVNSLPPGFRLTDVQVKPRRVWVTGARSQVLRINEIETESVDLSQAVESGTRQVHLMLGGGNVWLEEAVPVEVSFYVESETPPEPEPVPESAVVQGGAPEDEGVAGAGAAPTGAPSDEIDALPFDVEETADDVGAEIADPIGAEVELDTAPVADPGAEGEADAVLEPPVSAPPPVASPTPVAG